MEAMLQGSGLPFSRWNASKFTQKYNATRDAHFWALWARNSIGHALAWHKDRKDEAKFHMHVNGALGCRNSHVQLLKHLYEHAALDSSSPSYALVLEDDVRIHPEFWATWPKIIAGVPNDWDVIRFSCKVGPNVHNYQGRIGTLITQKPKPTYLVDYRSRKVSTPGGTHAILYRRDRIRRVLDYLTTTQRQLLPIDGALSDSRRQINSYCVQVKRLVHLDAQAHATSSIRGDGGDTETGDGEDAAWLASRATTGKWGLPRQAGRGGGSEGS